MNWLGLSADVKVRQKIQKNPKRNKIKEETKKIKIPTCEIILMRGGGDPDLEDKSSVFSFASSFGGTETKSQKSVKGQKVPGGHIRYVFGRFKSKLYDNIDTQVSSFLWVVFMKNAPMCKATSLWLLISKTRIRTWCLFISHDSGLRSFLPAWRFMLLLFSHKVTTTTSHTNSTFTWSTLDGGDHL